MKLALAALFLLGMLNTSDALATPQTISILPVRPEGQLLQIGAGVVKSIKISRGQVSEVVMTVADRNNREQTYFLSNNISINGTRVTCFAFGNSRAGANNDCSAEHLGLIPSVTRVAVLYWPISGILIPAGARGTDAIVTLP